MIKKKHQFSIDSGYGWTKSKPHEFAKLAEETAENILLINAMTPFTHLACSGTSGTSMSFILSVMLDIPVIYVRKKGEKSHGNRIECNSRNFVENYLVIDDFVDTGSTVDHIIEKISLAAEDARATIPWCVGAYLYNTGGSSTLQTAQGRIPLYGDEPKYYKNIQLKWLSSIPSAIL